MLEMPMDAHAVICAAGNGHEMCMEALINAGADVNICCEEGNTALILAASNALPWMCSFIDQSRSRCEYKKRLWKHALDTFI